MKKITALILATLLSGCSAMAAEAPPPQTDKELQLNKALVDTELLLLQYQMKDLLEQQKKLAAEIEKRKPPQQEKK